MCYDNRHRSLWGKFKINLNYCKFSATAVRVVFSNVCVSHPACRLEHVDRWNREWFLAMFIFFSIYWCCVMDIMYFDAVDWYVIRENHETLMMFFQYIIRILPHILTSYCHGTRKARHDNAEKCFSKAYDHQNCSIHSDAFKTVLARLSVRQNSRLKWTSSFAARSFQVLNTA